MSNKNTVRKTMLLNLYEESAEAKSIKNISNSTLRGESPKVQSVGDVVLTKTEYEDVISVREQNNIFASQTDRPYFEIDPSLSMMSPIADGKEFVDNNSVKVIEKDAGDLQSFISDISAKDKDKRVTYNNDLPITVKKTYLEKKNYTNNEVLKNMGDNWGFSGRDTTSPKVIRSTATQVPYVLITEDRAGTASYSNINSKGIFSNKEEIKLEILRNVETFTFGTTQEFDSPEPRGSQTPLRFYNKNSGRQLSFSADFHQQEYPLEPLLSIAEKAQYFCRPYKHGDYALIPKLVRVEIPGRVFRGYMNTADITYNGDDYRSWANLGLNESNIGKLGYLPEEYKDTNNPYGIYGNKPRIEYQTNRIRNDNSKEAINYGLSMLNVRFNLIITEEIILTTYDTEEEIKYRGQRDLLEERRNEIERALEIAQHYLDTAPITWEPPIPTAAELVELNEDGSLKAILIDQTGFIDPRVGKQSYISVATIGTYNSIKNSSPKNEYESLLDALPEEASAIKTTQEMHDYLVGDLRRQYPGMSEQEAINKVDEMYGNDPNKITDAYRKTITQVSGSNSLSGYQSFFLSCSQKYNPVYAPRDSKTRERGALRETSYETYIPDAIKNILDNKLNSVEDIKKFLTDYHTDGSDLDITISVAYINFKADGTPIYPYPDAYEGCVKYTLKKELWRFVYDGNKEELNKMSLFNDTGVGGDDFEDMFIDIEHLRSTGRLSLDQCRALSESFADDETIDKITMQMIYDHPSRLTIPGKNGEAILTYIKSLFRLFRDSFYQVFYTTVQKPFNEGRKTSSTIEEIVQLVSSRELAMYSDVASANKRFLSEKNKEGTLPIESKESDLGYFHHVYGAYTIS